MGYKYNIIVQCCILQCNNGYKKYLNALKFQQLYVIYVFNRIP